MDENVDFPRSDITFGHTVGESNSIYWYW